MSAKQIEAINKSVLHRMRKILESNAPDRYEQLDALWLQVTESHPHGLAAEVLETIGAAQTQVMYGEGGTHRR